MYDDDDYNPLEFDREYMHEIASDYGKSPSGKPLPRHTDKHGRVWVTCNCGSKFILRADADKPDHETEVADLDPDVAAAVQEVPDQEDG